MACSSLLQPHSRLPYSHTKSMDGSLRLTLGPQNTPEDVDYILERLEQVVKTLRAMSPIWHE